MRHTYLTILLETLRSLTLATNRLADASLLKDGPVLRNRLVEGFVANGRKLFVVVAFSAITVFAKEFVREAFAVHLQTLGLLAVALGPLALFLRSRGCRFRTLLVGSSYWRFLHGCLFRLRRCSLVSLVVLSRRFRVPLAPGRWRQTFGAAHHFGSRASRRRLLVSHRRLGRRSRHANRRKKDRW